MRVAVIGLGWWGQQIISCLAPSEKLSVTAAFDPTFTAGSEQARRIGVPLTDSYEAALSDPEIDGVILATPHKMHDDQVAAAVAAGKHVFCEKPLSLTADGIHRMIEACRASGVILGVGHERRFEPGLEEIARMVRDGEMGPIVSMDANFSHDKFKTFDKQNWRLSKDNAPAGAMTALGIHLTDYFISLAGNVESVHASSASRVFEPPMVDALTATLRFASGLTGTITCLSSVPFYGRVTVMGEKAWAEVREYSNVDVEEPAILTIVREGGAREVRELAPVNTVLKNFESWADAVAGRDTYRFTDQQKINNIEVLDAITRSADSGQPVRIAELAVAGKVAERA